MEHTIDYFCVLFMGDGVNFGLDVSVNNMQDCKEQRENAGEVNSNK
jgi:hypothetical protein